MPLFWAGCQTLILSDSQAGHPSRVDRTKPSQGDEEVMDMTTIDGVRVSKYSIKAIKVGKYVSAQMRKELEQFNSEHVGEDSVFPTENGAPKILEQFKDKSYALELRDEFTTGKKPKSLPTIKAMHYHGKPATCKVMEHFVRATPVVGKCDDPRCFSRLVIVLPKREPGTTKDSGRVDKPLFKTSSKHATSRHGQTHA